jgi:hypothetical protein
MDDDVDSHLQNVSWIERDWNELETHVPITVDPVATPQQAEQAFKQNPERYQLFVADIYFPVPEMAEQQPLGLMAITAVRTLARHMNQHVAIVAISQGNGSLGMDVKKAGADAFVSLRWVARNPAEYALGPAILESLRDNGFEPFSASEDALQIDDRCLPLASLVEEVGRGNILNCASRLISRQIKRAVATHIRGGLSGASVVNLECDLEPKPEGPPEAVSLLLKISKDRLALSRQVKLDAETFLPGVLIRLIKHGPVTSGNWHCIGSHFKPGAKAFLEWLRDGEVTPDQVENTISELFSERALAKLYRQVDARADVGPFATLWNMPLLQRRARISEALEELSKLAEEHDPYRGDALMRFDAEIVARFLGTGKLVGTVGELHERMVPLGVSIVWSHGDLHAGNILIDAERRAQLIDPSVIDSGGEVQMPQMHWACDIARLTVDLVVSGWDAGATSYEWNAMRCWCELSTSLIRNEPFAGLSEGDPNRNVYVAARWLRSHLDSIHDTSRFAKPTWEFLLAVAIEFLRASYRRQELPPPKRVLGLLAGCQALRAAEAAFKRSAERSVRADGHSDGHTKSGP